ncbi:hypothetical protein [Gracilibacillus phocaeensis]|uniref:hypothetical protein n=1 Tax=Gracilibacillus phocaeensis TaxID=2042304 RepID=UPI00256FBBB2|nr:hypothetical protein [Gracilibacillus phocaeensis]
MAEIKEVTEIRRFYSNINTDTLEKILYRMIKEKNGSGIIPIFVSTVPWLLFLFLEPLQKFLLKDGMFGAIVFTLFFVILLSTSVILHFREKAWAAFHIAIIKNILAKEKI